MEYFCQVHHLSPAHSPGLARMHQLEHSVHLHHNLHRHHTPGYPLGKSPHSDHPLVPAGQLVGESGRQEQQTGYLQGQQVCKYFRLEAEGQVVVFSLALKHAPDQEHLLVF